MQLKVQMNDWAFRSTGESYILVLARQYSVSGFVLKKKRDSKDIKT